MPRRSLELLEQSGAVLAPENHEVHALIRSVTPIPLFKIFVCYHTRGGSRSESRKGCSVTDLPIRQCYYWGVEGEQYADDPKNHNAALMATYDDTLNVAFWAGLRNTAKQELFATHANPHIPEHPGSNDWDEYKAPV